jgi:hypothetical protein
MQWRGGQGDEAMFRFGCCIVSALTCAALAEGPTAETWTTPATIDLRRTTLERALGRLGEFSPRSFIVEWSALYDVGVTRDQPVDLALRQVTPRRALELVLELVGERRTTRIAFDDTGDVVLITSEPGMARQAVTRIYDCADLLDATLDPRIEQRLRRLVAAGYEADAAGVTPLTETSRTAPDGGVTTRMTPPDPQRMTGRAVRVYNQALNALVFDLRERRAAELVRSIQQVVEPGSWKPEGGPGQITLLGDRLIITQTAPNHARIAGLLAALRSNSAAQTHRCR